MTNHDIIVIGGSTGAGSALKRIFRDLPADLPASVFVVTHVPAQSPSILAELLDGAGPLRVSRARDGQAIELGRAYVAAPDRHLLLLDGTMRLGRGPRENMVRPAIDPLFRSAALSYGPRVVGVLLSGLLNDGIAGLEAIKRCGGLTAVQDPADAVADEMPRNALEEVDIDRCAPAAQLGGLLAELVREPAGPGLPAMPDIHLEVEIAAGAALGGDRLAAIAEPATLTCPNCHGVLSELHNVHPLRYRCQIGHGITAETLHKAQADTVEEALRIALRVLEERRDLVARMARDARRTGRSAVAEMYEARVAEYGTYADTLRRAVLIGLEPAPGTETDAAPLESE